MSRSELQKLTVKVLREEAKHLNISGRWDMNKEELIEAILGAEDTEGSESKKYAKTGKVAMEGIKAGLESAKDEVKIDSQSVEVESKDEKESTSTFVDMNQKAPYIENVEIGTLVAFRLSNNKVKSAKVVNKSSSKRRLKLETQYGATYIVSYDDVLWVRTGKRWPRGIYNLLKGIDVNEKEKIEA